MATADEQGHGGRGQRAVLQDVHRHVGRQVVDAEQRLAQTEGERLGRGDPHQQGTRQTRAVRDGDRVEVVQADAGLGARPLDHGHHRLHVGAAGHLGDDTAEPRVLVHAAGDGVREQGAAPHDADAGLVAGRLDAEHQGAVVHAAEASGRGHPGGTGRSRITWASTSSGW